MNRTLLLAILVMAFTAMNCFAAETQQVAGTAASPAVAPPAKHLQEFGAAGLGKAEKSSPIVQADSRQDGIAPQKSQLEDATFPTQAAGASTAEADSASAAAKKRILGAGGTAPKMEVLSQATPATAPSETKNLGAATGPAKTADGGCQACKKKLTSGDNSAATEPTK